MLEGTCTLGGGAPHPSSVANPIKDVGHSSRELSFAGYQHCVALGHHQCLGSKPFACQDVSSPSQVTVAPFLGCR